MTWPGGGPTIAYLYSNAGDLAGIVENPGGGGVILASYGYDERGRRTRIVRGNGTETSFSYDNVDRLTRLVQDLGGTSNDLTLDFSYNPAGQIVSAARSNTAYSFVEANANFADTVNGLNQLTTSGIGHDARGNIGAIGGVSFTYSSENRLVSAGGDSFGRDPLGRIYASTEDPQLTRFLWDGDVPIGEYDSGQAVLRRYVQGPGGEPIAWYEGSGTSTRRWFHADERGSIVAVSDSSGNLVGSAPNRYDEYGNPQGGAITGRFGYTGQMFLPEYGLYDYRARTYHPGLGRFMQADPIGHNGGMNLYAYVGGDPINSADPSGLGPGLDLPPEKCEGDFCGNTGGPPGTGSRLPGGCGSCSFAGIPGSGGVGRGGQGSMGLYKVTDWDNGTGRPIATWFDIRLLGDWGFAAQGGGGRGRVYSTPTLRALLRDEDVKQQMVVAWLNSLGDGPAGGKNEYGFWITQVGNDFRAGEMIAGNGPFIDARSSHTPGASIFFHVHPFSVGETFEGHRINSNNISSGDRRIARAYSALIIAMARPGPGVRGTFSFFGYDCRGGC